MSFISDQLIKYLNSRYESVGVVESFDLGHDSASVTVRLNGEADTVAVSLGGICWSVSGGSFHLHYTSARASRPWLQGLLNILSEKSGGRVSFPDKLSLMPIKVMFPRHTATAIDNIVKRVLQKE